MSVASARFDPRVEAALLAHYGVDVHDREKVSLRRLRVLLECLPAEAWQDPGQWRDPWSTGDYLAARLVDEVGALRWLTAFSVSGKKPQWNPEPIPRPENPDAVKSEPAGENPWMKLAKILGGGTGD